MIRLRRYRLFLLVALLAAVTVYQLTRMHRWNGSALEGWVGFKPNADQATTPDSHSLPDPALPDPLPENQARPAPDSTPPPALSVESHSAIVPGSSETTSTLSSSSPAPDSEPTITGDELLTKQPNFEEDFGEHGQGRYEVHPRPSDQPRAYWKQPEEHFPVPSQSLIPLPTGEPNVLPRIQHRFGRETSSKKADRLRRQAAVRESFKHAWNGYKNHSLPHDELKPISKGSADPFNGWGATLVDSLDSLWIMGLHDEFDEAVRVAGKIDFKTSSRKDIPLFETTIRYLGGLIAAYDLSSGKYPVLLNKAVELADILMGAFDTPNRMPVTYYNWAPSYTSQPHRAGAHTVLAELGSLSVEFTRLAQITREDRYYDAVARITNALQEWQTNTTIPGLWPLKLDASGCRKPEVFLNAAGSEQSLPALFEGTHDDAKGIETAADVAKTGPASRLMVKRQDEAADPGRESVPNKEVVDDLGGRVVPVSNDGWEGDYGSVDCESQGLSTEPHSTTHTYGIGAMADSTYEYLPKEYALLGGLNTQYKSMYLDSMAVIREQLLYRPMTKENHDILFLAKQSVSPRSTTETNKKVSTYEGTHLGCFAGGMFALGAQVFGIPEDMNIAEKLTEGCVWAYGSTPVGIMPESFELVPCDSLTSCTWDETKWHEALDPRREERLRAVEAYNKEQQRLQEEANSSAEDAAEVAAEDAADDAEPVPEPVPPVSAPFIPRVPLSHEKYVAARIQEERLPPGYTAIGGRDYRLRPEAIESVFIMYRITGDESWREKGWAMFDAVDKATKTETANAAIHDVTSQLMEQDDTMESFWLAETLKYYYLLFSEPDLISLDDYVL
ncbi:mannosyl-oligosaccharide alpha-1,2-mannosidase [Capronia epimyces CBS 606.96]|uniref:alpha-1,2-Mannosidase n=1 Tax=Capronia epimyces CBS 606.96 TaxID=1182542 RepID=W9YH00_9EURO|nr:mannosyl-oligosaccharide alpha-1,2-mannosidase [Capronia epimyces CBS 606.96]EXJ88920.1 mannosyl-oligosaccharide alpha-1,2-mannosidase [Capronia epimyces CBS 606.96]